MNYSSLEECIIDLEKNGHLVRVKEEVDPYLEMASIQLRVYKANGPALLFEKVKGSQFKAASNLFGTIERSKFLFRETFEEVQQLIKLKNNPLQALKSPFKYSSKLFASLKALPKKVSSSHLSNFSEINISQLPMITHWKKDGGAFITLPQVYTEDTDKPGVMSSNLGMYRIQLNGNEYVTDKEIGLHYQLHRGIGVHQSKAHKKNQPLKVSVFIGGPPSHSLAAVMPLPEGMSELTFAGVLGGKRFKYFYDEGYLISADADFVITGEIYPNENKPEGPFGDHLGYYSLKHDFPVMRVHKVLHKKNAIWPFTVVGRPPQEDTSFGALIHQLAGAAISEEIPGLKEIHAVDAAGVHPLLLAVGSERYTPYIKEKKPAEILTIANHVLGTGQLSLAKFLFIVAEDNEKISAQDEENFFKYCFERINFERDVHFYTNTTIDTLDYSGTGINSGSKVVFAAYGDKIRELKSEIPSEIKNLKDFSDPRIVFPGVISLQTKKFETYQNSNAEIQNLNSQLENALNNISGIALIVLCDSSEFVAENLSNFLWTTFTRSNPSHDIHGITSETINKHWGCKGPLIIDARKKPHHAPELELDAEVEKKVDAIFANGGSLAHIKL